MRLIDADSLYRKVKTECNKYGAPTIDFESGNKVLDMIEQEPTVEPKQGEWIPCSERLPEKNGRYLTSWVSNLTNRYYIDSIFFAYGEWDCCNGDVEAWMPLPEPYMEGGDEK